MNIYTRDCISPIYMYDRVECELAKRGRESGKRMKHDEKASKNKKNQGEWKREPKKRW